MAKIKLFISTVLIVGATVAIGFALWSLSGFSSVEVTLTLTCLLLGLAQLISHLDRQKAREETAREIGDLGLATTRLTREVNNLKALILDMESEIKANASGNDDGLVAQIQDLEQLVRRMASSRRSDSGVEEDDPEALSEDEHEAEYEAMAARIRSSLETGKLDLYLQPIVTIPQRKIAFYEEFSYLRDGDGRKLAPSVYRHVAEKAGLMPEVNNLTLFRSVQVVRDLKRRNENVGLICNLSVRFLTDAEYFSQIQEFLSENQELAGSLIFEFEQSEIDAAGPLEKESLAVLARLGFGFSLASVTNMDIDFGTLSEHNFKLLKIDADILLYRMDQVNSPIQGEDLAMLMGRQGIQLIVDNIDDERTIANVLDFDASFGQGKLFSEPRLVRADNDTGNEARSVSA